VSVDREKTAPTEEYAWAIPRDFFNQRELYFRHLFEDE